MMAHIELQASKIIRKFIRPEPWPKDSLRLPPFQSHRGYWLSGALENSLQALRESHRLGFQMAEVDVQLTKDQVPILFHDEDLQRLAGRAEKIRELCWQDIQGILPVPSLEQVLKDPQIPAYLNIELKTKIKVDERLERRVAEVIQKTQSQSRVMFSSFNPFSIFRISQYLPEVPRALLVSHELTKENSWILRSLLTAPFLKISAIHFEKNGIDANDMEFWRSQGMPISVWTLKAPSEVARFQSWGAASLIVDMEFPS